MEGLNTIRGRRGYSQEERTHFAELVRQFGARGAREVLSRKVSHGTLLKIAAECGIVLKKGRRPALVKSSVPSVRFAA